MVVCQHPYFVYAERPIRRFLTCACRRFRMVTKKMRKAKSLLNGPCGEREIVGMGSRGITQVAILLVLGIFSASLPAQNSAQKSQTSASDHPTSQSVQKLKLLDSAPDSPEALARTLHPNRQDSMRKTAKENSSGVIKDSAVQEFQISDTASSLSVKGLPSKDSKKSILKNIHGEAYGEAGSGTAGPQAAGGAVGAGSKNGKTYIYVEGSHAHNP